MVGTYCSVEGCWDRLGGTSTKHTFPHPEKNPELYKKWVEMCANKRLSEEGMTPQKIYSNCRVCGKHFDEGDFHGSRLKRTAFPHIDVPLRLDNQSSEPSLTQTTLSVASTSCTSTASREHTSVRCTPPVAPASLVAVPNQTVSKQLQVSENMNSSTMEVEVIDDDSPDDPPPKDAPDSTANAEIVVLDDDVPECETIDLVRPEMTGSTKCINYACKGGTTMIEPPGFCLSFYRVKNKLTKKQQICTDCYDNAVEHYDRLVEALTDNKPLLEVELPFRNDVVEIDDSDSDEEASEDVNLCEETMQMLEEHFDNTMNAVLNKYEFDDQVEKAFNCLNKRCEDINTSFLEVRDMFKSIRTDTDEMIFQLSDILRPDNVELVAVDVSASKPGRVPRITPVRRQQRATPISSPKTPKAPAVPQPQQRATPAQTLSNSVQTSTKPIQTPPKPIQTTPKPIQTPPKLIQAAPKPLPPKVPPLSTITKPHAPSTSPQAPTSTTDSDWNLVVLQESHLDPSSAFSDAPEPPPVDLPPKGQLIKPPLVVGQNCYVNRHEIMGAWVQVTLKEIITPGTRRDGQIYTNTMYVVAIENRLKVIRHKIVTGREIAYAEPVSVQLEVGARVIAVFREILLPEDSSKRVRKDVFYPGIVAEPLMQSNKYRYLIFFDDGYAQYVDYKLVHAIHEASKDVWEDVNINSRSFIKKYLEKYPERPMVKLHKDQTIRTEYNGKWWVTTVMNVDCSLVQMLFDASGRVEWIYRGSTRLNPMFKEEQAMSNRLQHRHRMTRKPNSTTAPYVEYTRPTTDQLESHQQQRSVARKSTSRPPSSNNNITYGVNQFLPSPPKEAPATKIVYYTPRRQKPKTNIYAPHTCSPSCKDFMYCSLSRLKGYSPLSKPLLCGFYRLMYKAKNRKCVVYKAPCGRTLRRMDEVHMYLRITKSDLTVDLFDFNVYVRCLAEFMVEQKNILIKDLSQGKEECPITVVNYVNSAQLNFCNYSTKREPMAGVNLNTNTDFLTGCDCTDDCIDRNKCSCWQLTLQCLKYMDKDTDPKSVGYQYRRLPEPIFSGIYECNKRCKCASTCLNRVVQNPLHHKLQIFQTDMKGWGIRCLNDIPQGSFICIYAGVLLTEDMANRDGKFYGDEYLAELDFIETAERAKEDYEEDPYRDEDVKETKTPEESTEDSAPEDEDEEDEPIAKEADDRDFVPTFSAKRQHSEDSGIRTRLRKRQEEVVVKQEKRAPVPVRLVEDDETVMISDDEDYAPREPSSFNPKDSGLTEGGGTKYKSIRELFGSDEDVYIMDAKNTGNIGRFLNHSCSPNIFVQNVFVDTHDLRFPWVAFFTLSYVRAGTELTWNYNYDIGSVTGKELSCYCGSSECKGRLL